MAYQGMPEFVPLPGGAGLGLDLDVAHRAGDGPSGLRALLLTLAVVDDLLAITVIAFFCTGDFASLP